MTIVFDHDRDPPRSQACSSTVTLSSWALLAAEGTTSASRLDECQNSSIQEKQLPIVGGSPIAAVNGLALAEISELILLTPPNEESLPSRVCTGLRVSNGYILTAAHCVHMGALEAQIDGVSVPIIDNIIHPERDLVLLLLDDSACSRPWTVAMKSTSPNLGDAVMLVGFGRDEHATMGNLRVVEESVVMIDEQWIEVDGLGESGACIGDSGGPLYKMIDGEPHWLGILVKGDTSCKGRDLYLRVEAFRGWIEEVI